MYNGTVNVTESGLPCQRWDSQYPHSHDMDPESFIMLRNGENYCRNPAGLAKRPWCYTTDKVRWQHCDVPKCRKSLFLFVS